MDKLCSPYAPKLELKCLAREPLLISCARVVANLGKRLVTGDGRNLIGATSGIREPGRGGLAKPVGGTLRKARKVALLTEPVAETGRRKRRAAFGD